MKTTFKMKEATSASEAITSIENVLIENPIWLNKCTSDLFAVVKQCWDSPMIEDMKLALEMLKSEQIINLFIEMKTEYYNFKDNTQWI